MKEIKIGNVEKLNMVPVDTWTFKKGTSNGADHDKWVSQSAEQAQT